MPARRPYRVDDRAWAEVEAADDWYRARSGDAASEFVAEVIEAFEIIAHAPDRWTRHLYGTRRYLLRHFPFSIVSLDDAETVTFVAVSHNKRRPGYWKDRV